MVVWSCDGLGEDLPIDLPRVYFSAHSLQCQSVVTVLQMYRHPNKSSVKIYEKIIYIAKVWGYIQIRSATFWIRDIHSRDKTTKKEATQLAILMQSINLASQIEWMKVHLVYLLLTCLLCHVYLN